MHCRAFTLLLATTCWHAPAGAIEDLPGLISAVEPSVARLSVTTRDGKALGSGFVAGGFVVTNWHVVAGAKSASVGFADGASYEARGVVAYDADRDLAALAVPEVSGITGLKIAAATPRKGEEVFAFGAPKGFAFTTSDGIVSGIRRSSEVSRDLGIDVSDRDVEWVQTTAPISEGNSGGPLVNAAQQVVGVNTWYFGGGQNLNFACAPGEISEFLRTCSGKEPTPFSDLPAEARTRGAKPTDSVQRVLQVLFGSKLDAALEQAVVDHNATAAAYADLAKRADVSRQAVRHARNQYESSVKKIELLRSWTPRVGRIFEESSLIGRPGRWYVFQVLSEGSALIKKSPTSSETLYVQGIDVLGLTDRTYREFPGTWFLLGEKYSYTTVGGSFRSTYKIRAIDESLASCLAAFRQSHVEPAVTKAIEGLVAPQLPSGDDTRRLDEQRLLWGVSRKEEMEERRRSREASALKQEREDAADRALAMAKRFSGRRPDVERRYLREAVEKYPETVAAAEARRLLGIGAKRAIRTWRSGTHSTQARLLSVADDEVTLENENGKRVRVPISKLSDDDQEYVRQQRQRDVKEVRD